MSDIELIIKIPENTYKQIQALARNNYFEHDICGFSMRRIANGTPLPKGHGRLIDEERISLSGIHFKTELDHARMIGRLNSALTIIDADCETCEWSKDGHCAGTEECHLCMWESQYKPKTGHWILLDECANSGYYCSKCHKKVVKEGWSDTVKEIKYCPNCGARMSESKYYAELAKSFVQGLQAGLAESGGEG